MADFVTWEGLSERGAGRPTPSWRQREYVVMCNKERKWTDAKAEILNDRFWRHCCKRHPPPLNHPHYHQVVKSVLVCWSAERFFVMFWSEREWWPKTKIRYRNVTRRTTTNNGACQYGRRTQLHIKRLQYNCACVPVERNRTNGIHTACWNCVVIYIYIYIYIVFLWCTTAATSRRPPGYALIYCLLFAPGQIIFFLVYLWRHVHDAWIESAALASLRRRPDWTRSFVNLITRFYWKRHCWPNLATFAWRPVTSRVGGWVDFFFFKFQRITDITYFCIRRDKRESEREKKKCVRVTLLNIFAV